MRFEDAIKIDPASLISLTCLREKLFYNRKPTGKKKQELLGLKKLLPCVSKLHYMLTRSLFYMGELSKCARNRCCIRELAVNNPSQFPGMFKLNVINVCLNRIGGIWRYTYMPHVELCHREWLPNLSLSQTENLSLIL